MVSRSMEILLVMGVSFYVSKLVNANNSTTKILKQSPIVIKTSDSNYDQPNIEDYKNCMKTFNNCALLCHKNETCLSKCPNCPILVVEDMVIQGINDSAYKPISPTRVNSTNIIRLTNEIHNIIENSLGNLVANNNNNITIYSKQNSTKKICNNDKFGMGCNKHGPCCIIISNRHRQQHCGSRCQARVMYARPVVQCKDELDVDSCDQVIEYKPYRSKRLRNAVPNRCQYQEKWPYVSCPTLRIENNCSPMCLQIAYGYILQHGIPIQCVSCYKGYNSASLHTPPIGYAPNEVREGILAKDLTDEGWLLESEKWPWEL